VAGGYEAGPGRDKRVREMEVAAPDKAEEVAYAELCEGLPCRLSNPHRASLRPDPGGLAIRRPSSFYDHASAWIAASPAP
jgi:hypothetical protein